MFPSLPCCSPPTSRHRSAAELVLQTSVFTLVGGGAKAAPVLAAPSGSFSFWGTEELGARGGKVQAEVPGAVAGKRARGGATGRVLTLGAGVGGWAQVRALSAHRGWAGALGHRLCAGGCGGRPGLVALVGSLHAFHFFGWAPPSRTGGLTAAPCPPSPWLPENRPPAVSPAGARFRLHRCVRAELWTGVRPAVSVRAPTCQGQSQASLGLLEGPASSCR